MKPRLVVAAMLIGLSPLIASNATAQAPTYRVLATNKTSTMEKEMKEAGAEGFRFAAVMGGETASAGNQVVVLMGKDKESSGKYDYRLLATSKTSTMQKELQQAGDAGYEYMGQTVFESLFGGQEVVVILQKDPAATNRTHWEYRLLATSKTSTLEKELRDTSELGFEVVAMTVGKTAMGGSEIVVITRRKAK